MNNVVSLKDHRMANPKEAIMETTHKIHGQQVTISSPDKRLTYLNKVACCTDEFDELVTNWKKQHPKCNCIDF